MAKGEEDVGGMAGGRGVAHKRAGTKEKEGAKKAKRKGLKSGGGRGSRTDANGKCGGGRTPSRGSQRKNNLGTRGQENERAGRKGGANVAVQSKVKGNRVRPVRREKIEGGRAEGEQ